jgi:dCMP deaminase
MRVDQARPEKDETWLDVAKVIAKQSTCHRLAVGAVLVDVRGYVMSTGWNGRASGEQNCNAEVLRPMTDEERARSPRGWAPPPDARLPSYPHRCVNSDAPIGQPNGCESIHAEQNALMQCKDIWSVGACYVTHSPCLPCVKMLLNTSCKRVVFNVDYPSGGARELWERAGRLWVMR